MATPAMFLPHNFFHLYAYGVYRQRLYGVWHCGYEPYPHIWGVYMHIGKPGYSYLFVCDKY